MATPPSTMAQNMIGSQQSTIDTQTQNPISSNPTIPSPSPIPQQLPAIINLNTNPNPNVPSFQIQPLQQQVAVQQAGLYGGLMNFGGSAVVPDQQQQLSGSVGVGVGGNASNLSGAGATQFNLLTSPGQKVGLVQTSQLSSANSAGQSLQGMQQAIGTLGSSNLASQLMTTNRSLYGQKQQLAQQASLNNQQAQQQQLAGGVGACIGSGAFNFGGSAVVTAQQQQLAGGVGLGIGGNTSSLSQSALAGQSGPFPKLSGASATQSNQLTSPGQQVGLVQSSQFSSGNSAGQSLQGTQQAIGTMGSSNLASQLMTTHGALYAQQLQLSQQAPFNNQQLVGLPQSGQPATIQNQLLKQISAVSGSASLLPLQQPQSQQQLASSAQLQQSSLTLNQQQLPQLMQQPKPMGQPQLQQQLQHHQLLQQQLQLQQQYQRLQQQLASSAQLQQNSLTLNQQQLPLLMQQPKSMGQPLLQQQQQQQLLQHQLQLQQQYQRLQQQLASSAQLQQNSPTLNQLPQLMQQQKSMGQPLLQQQLQQQQLVLQQQQLVLQQQQQQQQRTQLLQQQMQALRIPGPTGHKSLSLTGSQPEATAFGMTTPGGSSSQGTRTNAMFGQTEIMSVVNELKETRKEVKAIIKILLRFFKVISIVMALFIFVTLFVVLIK